MTEMTEICADNRNGSPRETIHSVRISWTNIRVSTKTQKSLCNCFQTKKMPKEIIRNGIIAYILQKYYRTYICLLKS